jgi:heme/copper-type cytochrome/quinol oxidase subunit 1
VKKKYRHLYNTLLWSVLLYATGGLLGYMISGSNVIIPAHYHGSIVGVTMALMGLVYLLLPKLGYKQLNLRLARVQPVIYGSGQLMHVVGFAISGGYGTLRKTPGAAQTAEGQAALGLMGLGGLLSVVGGLLFVIAVYQALQKKNR